jgi:hypothetical protein
LNFNHLLFDGPIRELASIDADVKFIGLRHGGNTEGGNAELTETQLRALSGHKTAAMTALYTKETTRQRQIGARKRLEERTKGGDCRNEQVTVCRNDKPKSG